ncbi:outer membrane protein TolC [Parabacteroides sp. PFB2-10]|uniref:TolC family protein n=1 Tax=Parabacteroides sp. PFB2-10 TaxID=1742405 RepID=UPI002474AECA|nr:TolC family protein [Parabacteroides sp. PFB2-10]MDH6313405.1 outer membrane protein TolC [Parabacteroides sp. PFB2-10]MDL2245437.1 TolC family protein [Parabacteroides sp. OttesenSCG-928-J18]
MRTGKTLLIGLLLAMAGMAGAQSLTLTLDRTIALATDSSLEAFRSKNMFLRGYWQYRTFKAERLPSLTLNLTPAQYYRDITRRYDSGNNIDVYRNQQSFYAGGNLTIEQNFDLLGGSFFIDSDLGYIRNFGDDTYSQFTSVPIRVGYSQSLLGYNPFKWAHKLEPLKYDKAKKDLLYDLEEIGEMATYYFFTLAMAQTEYEIAREKVASSDTLYRVGQEKHKIASISQGDLLTLKLDAVNARNSLQSAELSLKRAMFNLASYLNFDQNTEIRAALPNRPRHMVVPVDVALQYARDNNPTFLGSQQNILSAEQEVDRTKKESMFNASFRASVGFNQVGDSFRDAYRNLLQQDVVSLSVSIPLVDWGVRRGKYNMARNNLNVIQISSKQEELKVEEDVIMTVSEFNIQQDMIASAEEALDLAVTAYEETVQRFMIGKADINSLTLSQNRQESAQRNYISALQNYWVSYYKIRRLTLYDFDLNVSLSDKFDFDHHLYQ